MPSPPPLPNYRQIAANDASKFGIPIQVFLRQINQESGFNPNAKSGAGAEGIAQFMPSTAAGYGLSNPFDPVAALAAAAKMDSDLLHRYGTVQSMLSAYNSGSPTAYQNPSFAGGQTFNYVRSILGGSPLALTAPLQTSAPSPLQPQLTSTEGLGRAPTPTGAPLATPPAVANHPMGAAALSSLVSFLLGK